MNRNRFSLNDQWQASCNPWISQRNISSVRRQANASHYGAFDNYHLHDVINNRIDASSRLRCRERSTIASRSVSAAEDVSLVISPYPKIDISWLITSISEAWKRSSLFIARRPGICERRGGPRGREEREREGRECRNHRRRSTIFFPQTLASCRFVIRLPSAIQIRNVSREKERPGLAVSPIIGSIQFDLA